MKTDFHSEDAFPHYDRLALRGQGEPPAQIQVNGKEILQTDSDYPFLSDFTLWYYEYAFRICCPYCRYKLRLVTVEEWFDPIEGPDGQFTLDDTDHRGSLKWCRNCHFWYWFGQANTMDYDYWRETFAVSKVRQFTEELPEGCTEELATQLRRNPELFHSVAPKHLEILVRDIFRLNYSHCESIHVGRPGDGGVDVLFIDADGGEWLIQVKRRQSPLAAEGVSTIRNLAGTLLIKNKVKGIVVSTADHFSATAWDAVHRLEKRRFKIELWDKGILNRMLKAALPQHPWREAVAYLTPKLQEHIESQIPFFDSQPAKWSYELNPRIASTMERFDDQVSG